MRHVLPALALLLSGPALAADPAPAAPSARPTGAKATKAAGAKAVSVKGDRFAVITDKAVQIIDTAGGAPRSLPRPAGEVGSCDTDPVAGGVWVRTADPGGETGTLSFVDVERGTLHPVVKGIPADIEDLIIDHGESSRIGGYDPVDLRVGLAIRMRSTPAVEPEIGCDGDAAWYCYVEHGDDSSPLLPAYEAQRVAITQLKLEDPRWLATIARRGGDRALWRTPSADASPLPRLAMVPDSNCMADPSDCGRAEAVAGTAYWRVIVSNDHGDLYHQTEQLFDPATKMFFTPDAPEKRSPKPIADEGGVDGMVIGPSGQSYMYGGAMRRFDGKTISLPARAELCGYMGAATRIGGPRG